MNEHDVVVIGAGPAGLAATVALARTGTEVLVVERRSAGSPLPRATVLSLRSMEILRSWGLAPQVLAGADRVAMSMLALPSVARLDEGVEVEVGYPTAAQSEVLSPTQAVCVAQDVLESVLLEHLATLTNVTLVRGHEVTDVDATSASVTVTMRSATGRLERVEAQYVVGADGAQSAVRAAAGINLSGPGTVFAGMRMEFRAPLWPLLGDHRHLLYVTTGADASGVLLPAGQGDRWLFGVGFGDDVDMTEAMTDDDLHRRLLRAVDRPGFEVRATRFDRFSAGAQLADRFSRGRVFLVGDAAHRVTPRGGTGLNVALADGYDVGWKIGWVVRAWAPASFLASYEAERRPVAEHNVRRSADRDGSRRPASAEVQVDLGGRIPHHWVGEGVSTLDLAGDGLTLLTADVALGRQVLDRVRTAPPVSVAPLDALTARSLGLGGRGAVLIRPDARPVAAWSTPPVGEHVAAAAADLLAGPHAPAAVGTDSAA